MKLLFILMMSGIVSISHAALFNPLRISISALRAHKNFATEISGLCECMQKEKTTNDTIIESIKTNFNRIATAYKQDPNACAEEFAKAQAQSLQAIKSQEDFFNSLIKERNERGGCAFINPKTRVWCPRYPEHQENERISQLEINTPCLCMEEEKKATYNVIKSLEAGLERWINHYKIAYHHPDFQEKIEESRVACQRTIKNEKNFLKELIQKHKQQGGCPLHNPKTKITCPHFCQDSTDTHKKQ